MTLIENKQTNKQKNFWLRYLKHGEKKKLFRVDQITKVSLVWKIFGLRLSYTYSKRIGSINL